VSHLYILREDRIPSLSHRGCPSVKSDLSVGSARTLGSAHEGN
jgi:hypothetical protein